jgi:hypothetical protein
MYETFSHATTNQSSSNRSHSISTLVIVWPVTQALVS